MAVYTHLEDRALRQHARSFRLGELVKVRGISAGTINSIYELVTTRGRFILRILEDRALSDAQFEEALLAHLADQRLPVPKMLAGRRGSVVSIAPRQQLSVFEYMPGRELGVFEVAPHHARQIGAFLGRMHLAGRTLGRRRRNRFGPERLERIAQVCVRAARVDPARFSMADIELLRSEVGAHDLLSDLPQGLIHGDLFIDNARFARGRLVGVIDFEMASTGSLAYDLAVALGDWAFYHDALEPERAAALVAGYQAERNLSAAERAGLYDLCRFAAARFALTRYYDFEVRARPEAKRLYKDYRHFMQRLAAFARLGRAGFKAAVLDRSEGVATSRS